MILFLFNRDGILILVQGYVKCEHSDEKGELVASYSGRGALLAVSSVLLGRVSLESYTAYTDCEVNLILIQYDKLLTSKRGQNPTKP